SVRAEGDPLHSAFMHQRHAHALSCFGVPKLRCVVLACSSNQAALGIERGSPNGVPMPKRVKQRAGAAVPDPRGAVAARGHNLQTVGAEGGIVDLVVVTHDSEVLASRYIPYAGGPVVAGGNQPIAVRAELGVVQHVSCAMRKHIEQLWTMPEDGGDPDAMRT